MAAAAPRTTTKKKVLRLGPARFRDLPREVRDTLAVLDPRRRKFVIAYCSEYIGNATQAAKAAGYSAKSAHVQGSWVLKSPDVAAAVEAWWAAFAMTSTELVARIGDLAKAHPGPFTRWDPATKSLKFEVTEENWERYKHWVRSVEVDPVTRAVTKCILNDPQKAQEMMAKCRKLYSDQPLTNFNLFVRMSDEELMQQAEELRQRILPTRKYLGRGPAGEQEVS